MANNIVFQGREPIGSSTYPMPSASIDYPKHLQQLEIRPDILNRVSTIYVHVPFCDQICSFCGFNKFISTEERKELYVESLIKEMQLYANQNHVKDLDIQSIYLGGGTPNSLSADQLDAILKCLHNNFNLNKDCQITCEGTPQNFTEDRIAVLQANNVKRVSAGIQTVNQTIRKEHLHMCHSEEQIMSFIERIQQHFNSFNLDFIYNLPEQTINIWNHDLDVALSAKSTHLTIYPLVLLERTRFYTEYVKLKKIAIPSEETELQFFDITLQRMNQSKFIPYTIRDWSLPDMQCKYIYLNAKCNQILAFGAGSHGYLAGTTYRNERNLIKYSELIDNGKLPIDQHSICTKEQLIQRFMVMGLRLFNLDMSDFNQRFDCRWQDVVGEKINDLVESGYLNLHEEILTHTPKGHIWANNIRTYFENEKATSVGYSDSVGIDETGKSHYSKISRIKAAADVEAHT